LSAILVLGLSLGYGGRFDAWAAITVFPAWAWLVPGLFLVAVGLRRRGNRWSVLVIGSWLMFLLAYAEEPWSLFRLATSSGSSSRASPGDVEVLRVVSLNCDVGNRGAAEEVAAYRPDVIMLQESPGSETVRRLASQIFGVEAGVVTGVDASLIVRGQVIPAELSAKQRATFVQARVRLRSGTEVEIINMRLVPALFRFDLWSPDCWRDQAENRRKRREQLREIARRIESVPETIPIIVGGDFNAPQGDAVFRLLRPRLHDTFAEGGRGWGNTIVNDFPVLRIDQIWTSHTIRAAWVVARRSRHSDHRMVVCDLTIRSIPHPE
jgi:vancomycin resistance protein VanJ